MTNTGWHTGLLVCVLVIVAVAKPDSQQKTKKKMQLPQTFEFDLQVGRFCILLMIKIINQGRLNYALNFDYINII